MDAERRGPAARPRTIAELLNINQATYARICRILHGAGCEASGLLAKRGLAPFFAGEWEGWAVLLESARPGRTGPAEL